MLLLLLFYVNSLAYYERAQTNLKEESSRIEMMHANRTFRFVVLLREYFVFGSKKDIKRLLPRANLPFIIII